MRREYHRWFSPHLSRDMELLIFGHGGARVLVFPTRCGRFYDYENWGFVATLREKIEQGWLQLFCVDSIDAESLYCFWAPPADRIRRHIQYEQYLLHEVLPLMWHRNPTPFTIAHGCSLGAYHAVNLALRHPWHFDKVLALSGRYDLTEQIGSFRGLFDGHYNDDIYFHTPSHYMANLNDTHVLGWIRRMQITLVIGEEDAFLGNNQHFSAVLWNKGIANALYLWHGEAHKARYWNRMVDLYM